MKCVKMAVALVAVSLGSAGSSAAPTSDGRWFADLGNGKYRNPVLAGDYSDPDVVRVGEDYYLVSSSFTDTPGLPVLHSRDLVNWSIIGHALTHVPPSDHYAFPRRGGGVWAPTIRYRDGRFLVYYPDPDRGIFLVTSADPRGAWTDPVLVDDTRGAIDPAPFWDDDGSAWMAFSYAMSRAGKANVVVLKRMNPQGTRTEGESTVIVDGASQPPVRTSIGVRPWQTTEGPKLYKREGWYYVFVPSGSVKGGWQGVFRSRAITGPYVGRNVLDQGRTQINGPHQGAWVTTPKGEDWFLHFQDRDSYGRVVHLQPMKWRDGWPLIGIDPDGDGIGEPVATYRKPALPAQPRMAPVADDEFESELSPAWQFGSNAAADWSTVTDGRLRLRAIPGSPDLYETGAVLSQKLPAPTFTATTRLNFSPIRDGERAGLAIHGMNFAWVGLERTEGAIRVVRYDKASIKPGDPITTVSGPQSKDGAVWLRMSVSPVTISVGEPNFSPYWPSMLREMHAQVRFAYSLDGTTFTELGGPFMTRPGRWVGAQVGLFAQAANGTPAATATSLGHADFDWFRVTP